MRYLNCWDNKNFWGARTGPLTHASAVKHFKIGHLLYKFCSIWRLNSSCQNQKLKLCFDAMALLAWWSAPELKLITKMSTTKLAIIFCSNATGYAFPVQFWSDNHNPWTKFHQNRYSRWWCKVTRKFVDTTNRGIMIWSVKLCECVHSLERLKACIMTLFQAIYSKPFEWHLFLCCWINLIIDHSF